MANLNKVFLMGNLTRDPELRYTPNGTAVVDFGMAMNRRWTGRDGQKAEDTCFVDCQAWARLAEVISEYCRKGSPLFVEGRLQLDTWEGRDGQKRSRIRVVVEGFQFIGGRRDGGENASGPSSGRPRPPAAKPQAPNTDNGPTDSRPDEPHQVDDDIPF